MRVRGFLTGGNGGRRGGGRGEEGMLAREGREEGMLAREAY